VQLDECMGRYVLSRSVVLRDAVFDNASWLALRSARKFAGRGEPLDDLVQVACIGLLHAIERFDPSRGVPFSGYATPTIIGELQRHFRDRTWAVHVPRRAKDLRSAVAASTERLSIELHRPPHVAEIAAHLAITPSLVRDVLQANRVYRLTTIGTTEIGAVQFGDDFSVVLDRSVLRALLAHLRPRERLILELRYLAGLSQPQIADRTGLSQVHVGRLITASLATLRVIAGGRNDGGQPCMN
jgi:RNA polymerase sigma-B factor